MCCPKRNTQSNQPAWSNNNNNNNNINNNNEYYQGSSTNHQNPVNQINQIYPTQQPNQIYQPNQGNQFYQPNQNYPTTQVKTTTHIPQPSQNYQEVVPNRQSNSRRSEQSMYNNLVME